MKKRILSLALVLVLTLALVPAALAAGETVNEYGETKTYELEYATWISGLWGLEWTNHGSVTVEFTNIVNETISPDGEIFLELAVPSTITFVEDNTFGLEKGENYYDDFWLDFLSVVFIDDEPEGLEVNILREGEPITVNTILKPENDKFYLNDDLVRNFSFLFVDQTPEPTPTPAPSVPGDTSKLKTTDGLVSAVPPSPVAETKEVKHTVGKGESLAAIAKKYGVKEADIKTWNKAYFDDLAARNKKAGTKVALEANIPLIIKQTAKKDVQYTVQKGETLWGIGFNYYGSMSAATVKKIKDANADYFKKTKGILEAGAVITLPGNGMLDVVITQAQLDKAAGMYLVKEGDTLGAIAAKYYGKADQWKKILEANKDRVKVIGNSPMIYENQWLVIPE